jgi:class 3 adenylate cyclase/tetratricopeptide (TPR) repeat protein
VRASDRLRPYVPGFVVDWLRECPDVRHRSVEGTLAFVDISGFTTLTERLADRGKVGAEEMTGLLDRTFAELLAVAYSHGAWLVKWGGDAVLLLFQGDGHAARACTAALGMRRTMGRVGRLQTTAGPVRLRVSTGVHSGDFDFFLVGSSHRELVIAGPGATTTAGIEAAAAAGQVAVSEATAARIPPRLLRREGDLVLVDRSPRTPAGSVLRPAGTTGVDLGTCLPAATREHLLSADDDAEHRLVAVAFVEFSGVDDLLLRQGPGAATAAVDHVVRACQDAAVRHGVTFWETDINRDGGKVMLVAGVPASTGADEDAMLAVARDVVDAGGALSVRVGVNRGRVFFGQFGPPYRRTMSVKGDAVNLAARLMGKAGPGEVLASAAALDRARTPFAVEPLPPFLVKGKSRPISAARVGPPRQADGGQVAAETLRLVGRRRELGLLGAEWRVARHGRLRVCDVVGEAGAGKSRLVRELCRETGAPLLTLRCDPYTATAAHVALRRGLRGLLGIADDLPRAAAGDLLSARVADVAPELLPWAPLLGAVLDAQVPSTAEVRALDERFLVRRQEEATIDLLLRLLPEPTLVVVDDAHLLDPSTAQLLARLPERAPVAPWLVVSCRRDDGTGVVAADGRLRLDLEPLDRSAALELLHAVTDAQPLAPHDAKAVVERAGGNPLFLAELAASAGRGAGVADLPDSVEGVVTARIDRLAPPDRTLLRAAAVVGLEVERAVLDGLAARAQLQVDDAALLRLDPFLERTGPGTWRFRHALVQETAYEGLPYSRRAVLHGHLGDVLVDRSQGGEADAAVLSLHFLRANRHESAWHYARVAGARAQAVCAPAEAAALYERALEAARSLPQLGPELAQAWEALGDARYRLGAFAAAGEAFLRARRAAPAGSLDRARLHVKSALTGERLGAYRTALRRLTEARTLLDAMPPGDDVARLQAELHAARASVLHWQGRHADAVRECRTAVQQAEQAAAADVVADALVWMDVSLLLLGEGDGSEARKALQMLRDAGDRPWQEGRCLNHLGVRSYFAGRWDEARRYYELCREANARAGDEWAASVAQGNEAEILADQGRLVEAESALQVALRVWRASAAPGQLAFGLAELGRIASRQGRTAQALDLLSQARALYAESGEADTVLDTDARVAECHLLAGDPETALALVDGLLPQVEAVPDRATQVPGLLRLRGLAMAELGDTPSAAQCLEASLVAARERRAEHEVAFTLHARLWLAAATGAELPDGEAAELVSLQRQLGIVAVVDPPTAGRTAMLPAPRSSVEVPARH